MIWLAAVAGVPALLAKPQAEVGWRARVVRGGGGVRCATMSRAAMAAALVAAGWAVEKTYGRARLASQSMSDCRPQTKPPPRAEGLAERADADVDAQEISV